MHFTNVALVTNWRPGLPPVKRYNSLCCSGLESNPRYLWGLTVFPLEMMKMLKGCDPCRCKCQSISPPLLKTSSSENWCLSTPWLAINLQATYWILSYTHLFLGRQVGWLKISALPLPSWMILDGITYSQAGCTLHKGVRGFWNADLPICQACALCVPVLLCAPPTLLLPEEEAPSSSLHRSMYVLVVALTSGSLFSRCMFLPVQR